ncbi:MAG: enoyl-CoA hydratase/isomerase family protein [Desulfomonilaceae bacterium]|nr:enoyl-CoA hydratase/isomerase family protein [Desulfomonilaceae bacterium]
MAREYEMLICTRKGPDDSTMWITLNNERMMNSLTETMQLELHEVLSAIAFDNTIRCVVLTGAGTKAFCSGGDINLFQRLNNVTMYDFLYQRGNDIQRLITYMEKPVIAAVNGLCYAGGLELALACDFIYASQNAAFGLLEINLGLLAGWGGTVRLPRTIPVARAKEMIYRGERMTADEALQWRLVNRVFPSQEKMYEAVNEVADEIVGKSPLALRAAKNVINNSITCDSIEAALAIERGSIMWLVSSEDMKEGVAAFVEKRAPKFQGT